MLCSNCPKRLILAMGAALASTAMLTEARADVSGVYANPFLYNLTVSHMPDLDQRRTTDTGIVGLPGGGGMYCVPTANMNLFIYAANHGFPGVMPGSGWWQSQSKYNQAGTSLLTLGLLMGTDAAFGTNGSGSQAGGSTWLGGNLLTLDVSWASGDWSPTLNTAAQALASGAIVAICYGRYQYFGSTSTERFLGPRTGGHCITLVGAARSGSNLIIKVRDPADEPDKNINDNWRYDQSPFADKVYDTAREVNATSLAGGWSRPMSLLIDPPLPPASDPTAIPTARLIDTIYILRPMLGMTWQPGVNDDPPLLHFTYPHTFDNFINADHAVPVAAMSDINDIAISPDSGLAYVVGHTPTGGTVINRIDMMTGEATLVTSLDNVNKLVFGRKRGLYVLANTIVRCLDVDDPNLVNPITASVVAPDTIKAIAYDDATDEVVMLSSGGHKIYRYPHTLQAGGAGPQVTCVPGNIVMEGDGSVTVNPVDGKAWFCTEGSNAIYHVPFDALCEPTVELISFSAIQQPRSLSFDDMGHMFVVCNAGLKELVFNQRQARWELALNNPFEGVQPGQRFVVSRSRTNYDPAIHSGPEWNNVQPDEEQDLAGEHVELDCLADIVDSATFQPPGDGMVDGADLAYLLGAWGANEGSIADIVTSASFQPPGDGIIDGADLAYLLGAWGECP